MVNTIYEPRGKALEYSPLAVNLYNGCSHGCRYCYAPCCTYRTQEAFLEGKPKTNVLHKLEKDAKRMKGDPRPILLCFTCDPYQLIDQKQKLTRMAIRILMEHQLTVQILTKGGPRAERDFELLKFNSANTFGSTLTFINEEESIAWEPGAALPLERLDTLRKAHQMGIRTWVSLEPVVDPEQALELIRRSSPYVDHYKIGKMNYVPFSWDLSTFLAEAVALLESLGKSYYIKRDTLPFLKEVQS